MFATIEDDDMYLAEHPQTPIVPLALRFQQRFDYKYCFTTISGIEAFRLTLDALHLTPMDEIILPAYTCDLLLKEARKFPCQVAFCDIELDTYGLDRANLVRKMNKHTKVIVAQHLFGVPSRDIELISGLARKHGKILIEDCAQALGVYSRGKMVGKFGDVAIFSFGRSKTITSVIGGMIATNNSRIADNIEVPTKELSKVAVRNFLNEIKTLNPRTYVPRGFALPLELETIALNQLYKLDRVDKILGVKDSRGIRWFKCLDSSCKNARWAGRNLRILPKDKRI